MTSKNDGTLGEITFTIVQIKIIIVISYAFTRMGEARGDGGRTGNGHISLLLLERERKWDV
jgi:hypothetical protein